MKRCIAFIFVFFLFFVTDVIGADYRDTVVSINATDTHIKLESEYRHYDDHRYSIVYYRIDSINQMKIETRFGEGNEKLYSLDIVGKSSQNYNIVIPPELVEKVESVLDTVINLKSVE